MLDPATQGRLIEIWFGIITRQSIRRGTFASVTVLISKIRAYIDAVERSRKPFVWTATAERSSPKSNSSDQHQALVDNNAK